MDLFSVELQDLIKNIAKKNGIENFLVKTNSSVSGEGDNYIGILEALYITDKNSSKKLNLVLKRAPTSKNLRKHFPTRPMFLREIILYDEIFPEFEVFQNEYNIVRPFACGTDFYGFISDEFKEILILENLKEHGFRICNRTEPLDAHHLSLVLTTYARLHAVSLAMKRLEPEKFKRVTSKIGQSIMVEFQNCAANPTESKDEAFNLVLQSMFASTLEAVQDNPRLVERINHFKNTCWELVVNGDEEAIKGEYGVVGHADCWSANMMFKYEDKSNPNIPTQVNLIDWQMSCLIHLVYDISYFFYINAAKDELRNYEKYLRLYYTALCQNLTNFGFDPKSFFQFEGLKEQWKKCSKMGFYMCVIMLEQSVSDKKTHDFEEMAEAGWKLNERKLRKSAISNRFKQRMSDLAEFLVDNEFI